MDTSNFKSLFHKAANSLLAAPVPVLGTGKRSALLIDDDPDQLAVFETILEDEGLEVRTARDGASALNLMSELSFDLIVVDLRMPEMDGLQFAECVRQRDDLLNHSTVPIIVLTALCLDLELAVLKAGATMFCEKRVARKLLPMQIRYLSDR